MADDEPPELRGPSAGGGRGGGAATFFVPAIDDDGHGEGGDGTHVGHVLGVAAVGGTEGGANEAEGLHEPIILDDADRGGVAVGDHANPVLLEQEAGRLGDVCCRIVEADVGFEVVALALGHHFAVFVVMELVHHDTVVASELADMLDDGVTEDVDVTTR